MTSLTMNFAGVHSDASTMHKLNIFDAGFALPVVMLCASKKKLKGGE